jgi:hypothetical protein
MIARRIVEARQRHGAGRASALFQGNSIHAGDMGHIYAFHHGGRWEPQFNLGWFSSPPLPSACFRVGLGFSLTRAGRDPDPEEGQERIAEYFDRFQRVIATTWKEPLIDWMTSHGGFVEYDAQPPAVDRMPRQAVESLAAIQNTATLGWLFCGRWLFLDRASDAAVLSDRAKLATAIDETFRALFPIWLAVYTQRSASSTSGI